MSEETVQEVLKSNAVPTVFKPVPDPTSPDADKGMVPVENAEAEETEESASLEADDADKPKKKPGINKRIGELTREKYEARHEAESQKARADALERQLQEMKGGSKPATQAPADGRPTLADHDYDMEAFSEAMADWKAEQRDKQRQVDADRKSQLEREQAARHKLDEFRAADPEAFERAAKAPINYTPAMVEAVMDSDLIAELGVYLADNLDEADAISRMGPIATAKAIGKIEAELRAKKDQPKPSAPPKKITNAPPPPKTLAGASPSKVNLDDPNITPAQRIAAWRAQRQAK